MRRTLLAIAVALVGLAAWFDDSPAECRKTCQAGERRDGRGCCVAAPPAAPPSKATPSKPGKPARPTKPGRTKRPRRPAKAARPPVDPGGAAPSVGVTAPARPAAGRPTDELIDACRDREAAACRELAARDDRDIDPGTYAEAMTIGCDLAVWAACTELGAKAEKGAGVKQDFARARALYAKACEHHDQPGCDRLGQVYFLALGVVKDVARARGLFRKACDAGFAGGCGDLGYLEESEGNFREAATLYEQACDQGSGVACGNAALLFERAEQPELASSFYQKACALGRADMCGR
ncbi:MAG: SEL1-like repeat protein [Myxococcales bacterium]|nr:SEL1-like repeat protein [Myxococcales bacterium]